MMSYKVLKVSCRCRLCLSDGEYWEGAGRRAAAGPPAGRRAGSGRDRGTSEVDTVFDAILQLPSVSESTRGQIEAAMLEDLKQRPISALEERVSQSATPVSTRPHGRTPIRAVHIGRYS